MKKNSIKLLFAFVAIFGAFISSARADLGLARIMAQQGAPGVGQAVLNAAQAAFANGPSGTPDPVAVQNQLIAILNEAAATGNEQAVRYAIIAVMIAGGIENIDLSKTAINNSNVFIRFESLTAVTVAATQALLSASVGVAGNAGGGGGLGGGQGGGQGDGLGGGGDQGGGELGGGAANPFLLGMGVDPNNPFTWGSLTGGGDNDVPATRT